MSVQTQIDRISGNVSAALAAIAGKGVTVPDGSTSDALAELIASIEAGGGDQTIDGRPFAWGILTPAENITSKITLLTYSESPWLNIGNSSNSRNRIVSSFITLIPGISKPNFATLTIGSSGPAYWNINGSSLISGSVCYYDSSGNLNATKAVSLIDLDYGVLYLKPSNTYPLVAGESYLWLAVQIIMPEDFT